MKTTISRHILCLGDSNTYGYDPRSYLGSRYPDDVRWTGLLRRAGWEVVNCGQNGLSIPRASAFPALSDLLRSELPLDAVTVMLGSNDLLLGASVADTAARMAALLRCIRSAAPRPHLLLIAPPPMQPGEWVPSQALIDASVQLAESYRTLAAQCGLPFADAGDWAIPLTFDGVHFSPAGHAAFAREVRQILAEICG
jgi:lysophospholipase L1-like esterase